MAEPLAAIQVGGFSFVNEGVERVLAAFRGGATGAILSRNYSEMRLDNVVGAGDALAQWEQAARSPRG